MFTLVGLVAACWKSGVVFLRVFSVHLSAYPYAPYDLRARPEHVVDLGKYKNKFLFRSARDDCSAPYRMFFFWREVIFADVIFADNLC